MKKKKEVKYYYYIDKHAICKSYEDYQNRNLITLGLPKYVIPSETIVMLTGVIGRKGLIKRKRIKEGDLKAALNSPGRVG